MSEFPPYPPTKYAGPISPTRTEASFNKERPDAAPPKEVMQNEDRPLRATSDSDVTGAPSEPPKNLPSRHASLPGQQGLAGNRTAEHGGPPSDAAPVAWRYYRKDQTGGWRYTEKKPLLGKHPEDYEVQLLYAHPEDAPGGPYYREVVARFAAQMEAKLREHDASRGDSWRKMSTGLLFDRLLKEVDELKWTWPNENRQAECVDIANFAMFLWDRFRGEGETDG